MHLSSGYVDGIHKFSVSFSITHEHYVVQAWDSSSPLTKSDSAIMACPTEDGGAMVVVLLSSRLMSTGIDALKVCKDAARSLGGDSLTWNPKTPWIASCLGPKGWRILSAMESAGDVIQMHINTLTE